MFFGELYLRSTVPFLGEEVTAREVDYLAEAFSGRDGPIVDLGCGHGRHAAPLAKRRRVVGIDLDPLSLAERRRGFDAVRGDLFHLPFADRSIRCAFAWYSTLFVFEDDAIERLFREVSRCLRPGGLLVFHTVPYERVCAEPLAAWKGSLPDGSHLVENSRFDPLTHRDYGVRELRTVDGRVLSASFFIRYFPLPELTALLDRSRLTVEWTHGGLDGEVPTASSADLIVGATRKG
jgi:SAM-dependent methyltransferase